MKGIPTLPPFDSSDFEHDRAAVFRFCIYGCSSSGSSAARRHFNPSKTVLGDFTPRRTAPREQALDDWSKSNDEISGYIEGARRHGLDLFPALMASATPKGPVTDDAFNTLTGQLIAQLKAAPHLDGLLLALHGAMVAESYADADTEILRRLRQAFGPKFPIVVTHDFHANVSEDYCQAFNRSPHVLENPPLDTRDRGIQQRESCRASCTANSVPRKPS